MKKLSLSKMACVVFVFCAAMAIDSVAQTFTILANFNISDGSAPGYGQLAQGTNGDFYGTTVNGGANLKGTVFKVTPGGALSNPPLYSFCSEPNCTDGANPNGVVLATNGNFYGTTGGGGANEYGTVFKITPAGKLTKLHDFDNTDGAGPVGTLIQATDGNFYGTTGLGGANGWGTVFKITPAGSLTTIYNFCSQPSCADGGNPYSGLVQGSDGNFYGTTNDFGASIYGTVFKLTPAGGLTVLHSFAGYPTDGAYPYAALVQASDGNFYGTTINGGSKDGGTVFSTTSTPGTLTTLYNFCVETDCTDGYEPTGTMVQGTDGYLYGTTEYGGEPSAGTIFRIPTGGGLTTLYNFCDDDESGCAGGPGAGLVQGTDGNFYGTSGNGGTGGAGTVFSLSMGLGPFVGTNPTSGKVGATVLILGNNLKNTTSVTFNGTQATLLKVNPSEIKTTVPMGATTGPVLVTTPSGVLQSNVPFTVTPSFTLSDSPSSLTITQGGAAGTSTIAVTGLTGFSGRVRLAASGLPSGVTATFGTNPTTSTSVLTLTASSTATIGTTTVTIKGSSGSLRATTTLVLTVNAPATPNFAIAASPTTVTVPPGSNGTSTITITSQNGFDSATTLSATGLPSGVTAAFSTNPVTPPANGSATSTLTLTASSSAMVGTASVTITGTSGSLTNSTPITLTVVP